jgi:phage baseplate assembly protein W
MVVQLISPVRSRPSLFSDFHKDMTQNPISEDLAVKRDEEAVKEAIKNLILTDRGERLMQPLVGGNIRAMLFENNTPATIKIIQETVKETIRIYEPRATLLDVIVQSSLDESTVQIAIYFYINNIEQPITLTVFLERTR